MTEGNRCSRGAPASHFARRDPRRPGGRKGKRWVCSPCGSTICASSRARWRPLSPLTKGGDGPGRRVLTVDGTPLRVRFEGA